MWRLCIWLFMLVCCANSSPDELKLPTYGEGTTVSAIEPVSVPPPEPPPQQLLQQRSPQLPKEMAEMADYIATTTDGTQSTPPPPPPPLFTSNHAVPIASRPPQTSVINSPVSPISNPSLVVSTGGSHPVVIPSVVVASQTTVGPQNAVQIVTPIHPAAPPPPSPVTLAAPKPVQTVQPVQTIQQVKPGQQVQLVRPVHQTQPVHPIQTVQTAQSIQNVKPIPPVQPEVQTVSALKPPPPSAMSTLLVQPAQPSQSAQSIHTHPSQPVQQIQRVHYVKPLRTINPAPSLQHLTLIPSTPQYNIDPLKTPYTPSSVPPLAEVASAQTPESSHSPIESTMQTHVETASFQSQPEAPITKEDGEISLAQRHEAPVQSSVATTTPQPQLGIEIAPIKPRVDVASSSKPHGKIAPVQPQTPVLPTSYSVTILVPDKPDLRPPLSPPQINPPQPHLGIQIAPAKPQVGPIAAQVQHPIQPRPPVTPPHNPTLLPRPRVPLPPRRPPMGLVSTLPLPHRVRIVTFGKFGNQNLTSNPWPDDEATDPCHHSHRRHKHNNCHHVSKDDNDRKHYGNLWQNHEYMRNYDYFRKHIDNYLYKHNHHHHHHNHRHHIHHRHRHHVHHKHRHRHHKRHHHHHKHRHHHHRRHHNSKSPLKKYLKTFNKTFTEALLDGDP